MSEEENTEITAYNYEELLDIEKEDLILICRDIKNNIIPTFTKIRKHELIKFILTFQKYIT